MGKHYRQGDVLIEEIEKLPASATKADFGDQIVLAQSEVTSHVHRIASSDAQAFEAQGRFYIEVLKHTEVRHEEHSPVKLEPGFYKVTRQREYLPEGPRYVRD